MFLKRLFQRKSGPAGVHMLRRRLENFRSLVDRNNRVLELFADAGEMLGGEYIFDTQYLRTLAEKLEQEVRGVVYDLSALTDNSYPQLVKTLRTTHAEIRNILDYRFVVPETAYIIPLERATWALHDAIGEKMARLGELRNRLGCRIPDGFVITVRACRSFFESAGILPLLEGWDTAEADGEDEFRVRAERLRRAVLEAPVPRDVERAIHKALKNLRKHSNCTRLALRSSAPGEDGDLTFAGQFVTRLGVDFEQVCNAYRDVLTSLFSPGVMAYRQRAGLNPVKAFMAVGCMNMINARTAGVLYTINPSDFRNDSLLITATAGIGRPVVEGSGIADRLEISRHPPFPLLQHTIGNKETMLVADADRGLIELKVSAEDRLKPCLGEEEAGKLAEIALRIERFMKCAQDIEWAIDREGGIHILQARPLRAEPREIVRSSARSEWSERHRVILHDRGAVACRGIGAGPVVVVQDEDRLSDLPQGAVLVARTSSPKLSAALLNASAVIADMGTPTGHLAVVAREFRVPMIVDTGNATSILRGVSEATVDAEDNIVYEGIVHELVRDQLLSQFFYQDAREFRLLRKMLELTAPLNLEDPQSSGFNAASCKTYHDIIRFAHEKAVQCLIERAWVDISSSGDFARRLDLEVPLDLIVLDLGGGMQLREGAAAASIQDIRCIPLVALLQGVLTQGVWSQSPADMDLNGFMASATRPASLVGLLASRPQQNLAIVSPSYLHLSLKLGYHFNIIDCYLTETRNDNFIYFRFAGGVTELTRRKRRARLLKSILEKHDFLVDWKGDLVIGRIKDISSAEMENRLGMIGRLIGFARQLDISLRDDMSVESCIDQFMEGKYDRAESLRRPLGEQ